MTTKARNLVNSILNGTAENCTSRSLLESTLTESVMHLVPTAWTSRAQIPLCMEDFLDPSKASRGERRQVQKLLDRVDILARDCDLNGTKLAVQMRQAHMERENFRVGMLFASKSIVQLLVNPCIGPLTNR